MKNLILSIVLLLGLTIQSIAQVKFPLGDNGQICYTEVITVDSMSKQVLFQNANQWFVKTFVNAQNVIQYSDPEAGKVIGKGLFKVNYGTVSFTAEIAVKDYKYKYNFTNLWHNSPDNAKSPGDLRIEKSGLFFARPAWDKLKVQSDEEIRSLISSIKTSMLLSKNNDNW